MKIVLIFVPLLLLGSIIITTVNGVDEIEAKILDVLKILNYQIDEQIKILLPEIHEKFESAKMRDKELEKILTKITKLFEDIYERMDDGHMEMMQFPELNIKEDIDALLEAATVTHLKDEPALIFLDSTEMIVKNIFNFLTQRLGWLDFMFKTTMKPFFEKFEGDELSRFHAMPEIRNLFGKCLKLIERGQIHVKKWIDKQEMQKFELYARHRYLREIVNSSIELYNELAKNRRANDAAVSEPSGSTVVNANSMAKELVENFIIDVQPEYLQLERNIRILFGTFQSDAKPINEEMAKKLTLGDQIMLDKLLNARRNEEEGQKDTKIYHTKNEDAELEVAFKNLSLNEDKNDDENWKQLREWESQVLIIVGHVLMAYFEEEEKYLDKLDILQAEDPPLMKIKKIKTSRDWMKDLVDYTNDAPLLKENYGEPIIWHNGIRVPQKSKYPQGGFIDLFMQKSDGIIGLVYQAFFIMHIAQIKEEFELAKNKEVKTGKDNLLIKKYNEHRQFIEGMAKMRSIVGSALILHIGMQHWYLEKSPENAEKVKKYFDELQNTLKNYGIEKGIDAYAAIRLANCRNSQQFHCYLYEELFGVNFDISKKEISQEWTLLVDIGILLKFFYKEKEEFEAKIEEELQNLSLIETKTVILYEEIYDKFEKAISHDKELEKIQMEFTKMFEDISKRIEEWHKEMKQLPEFRIKEDIGAILEPFTIGNIKIDQALIFVDSTEMIVKNIFNFLTQRLGWLDFMFKTTMKPFFERSALNKFKALLEIRNLFGKCLKLIERGQIHIKKWITNKEMQKFELFARHRYLQKIVNSTLGLYNELAKYNRPNIVNANTMAVRLGDNFSVDMKPKYLQLERNIKFLFATEKPIDEEIAKKLANGDQIILDKLLNARRKVKVRSQNDKEDWKQLREWESQVFVLIGKILLMGYFDEEAKYLEKIDTLNAVGRPDLLNTTNLSMLKTESSDYLKDLVDYTKNAPLLKQNYSKSKYPRRGFVDLFLQQKKEVTGLVYQAFFIMRLAQIKKEFELKEKNGAKNVKDKFLIKKYNENRQFIDGMAKMRLIVWPTLILHIGMQHWYLEKSPKNAEKVKKIFNELQNTLKLYGIKKEIDAHTAMRLAESEEHSHNLYQELFGVDYDHDRKEIEDEWTLLVSIGKLLEFFYNESGQIEKALTLAQMGEATSSSSTVN